MKGIRQAAAEFLLGVKGFRPSAETVELEHSGADRQLGGHFYFVELATDFRAFCKLNPDGRQTHAERAAMEAIAASHSVFDEMVMACGGRIGAVPESFHAMSEESLGRVFDLSMSTTHSLATFMGPTFRQRDRGAARGRQLREGADRVWADRFLEELIKECAPGRIEISRSALFKRVAERLQDLEPGLKLPGAEKVLARMAEWELEAAYVRYEPGTGWPSFVPR